MHILSEVSVDPIPISSLDSNVLKMMQTCVNAGPSLMIGNTDTQ